MGGYPTFQDVKLYLGISSTKDDALIVATLKRAIAIFENLANRSFLTEAKSRYFGAFDKDVISGSELFIRDGDLLSISSLEIAGTVVPPGEYFLTGEIPHYKVKLKASSNFSFREYNYDPENSITLTGLWGYDTEVPEDVFGAIVRLTAWLYQQKDNAMELDRPVAISNAMILPAAIPSDVEQVAKFYRKVM